jgi:peptide chain release factor 1
VSETLPFLSKLEDLERDFEAVSAKMADPAIAGNVDAYREQARRFAELEPLVGAFRTFRSLEQQLDQARAMARDEADDDLRAMARDEARLLEEQVADQAGKLRALLLPKDPDDDKNVVLEVRAGVGGDEASLFAADLVRMYQRWTEREKLSCELVDLSESEIGGVKEAVLEVRGKGAFARLKYESGVHRVQRVPETEAQGRIHTSAATVAVLPEAEDVDLVIDESKDLRIDKYSAGGPGGQHVNKTESAIRITHLPSGIVVQCQDERSQYKNLAKAMKILRARVLDKMRTEQNAKEAQVRSSMVKSGDRSERIRTYNYPQNRVTDHRIGLTLHKLDQVMLGDLNELIEALAHADQAEKLKAEVSS